MICKKHNARKVRQGRTSPRWCCLQCNAEKLRKIKARAGGAAAYRNKHRDRSALDHQKYLARKTVENRLKAGTIKRRRCEICGSKTVHAHHEDYSKPDKINWLCPQHHKDRHKKKGRTSQSAPGRM